jgi:heme/copper-type cytochrome/quinol oxidase subunit 4
MSNGLALDVAEVAVGLKIILVFAVHETNLQFKYFLLMATHPG